MDLSHLNRVLQPLVHRIKLAVSRGKVRRVYKRGEIVHQRLQVELLAGELSDGMEHFEPYGFTASPVLGAGKIILRVDALDIKCGPSTLQMDAAGIRLAGPRIDLN